MLVVRIPPEMGCARMCRVWACGWGRDIWVAADAGYRRTAVRWCGREGCRTGVRFESRIWRPAREHGLEADLARWSGLVDTPGERYRLRKIVCDPTPMALADAELAESFGPSLAREYRFQWADTGPDSVVPFEQIQSGGLAHNGDETYRTHVLNMREVWAEWCVAVADHPAKQFDDSEVPNDAGIATMMLAVRYLVMRVLVRVAWFVDRLTVFALRVSGYEDSRPCSITSGYQTHS